MQVKIKKITNKNSKITLAKKMEEEEGEVLAKPHPNEILAFFKVTLIGEKGSGKPLMSTPTSQNVDANCEPTISHAKKGAHKRKQCPSLLINWEWHDA